ncbi:MAG: hypothetical protein RRY34_10770, partial [Victivallaceae bacterium]
MDENNADLTTANLPENNNSEPAAPAKRRYRRKTESTDKVEAENSAATPAIQNNSDAESTASAPAPQRTPRPRRKKSVPTESAAEVEIANTAAAS